MFNDSVRASVKVRVTVRVRDSVTSASAHCSYSSVCLLGVRVGVMIIVRVASGLRVKGRR